MMDADVSVCVECKITPASTRWQHFVEYHIYLLLFLAFHFPHFLRFSAQQFKVMICVFEM